MIPEDRDVRSPVLMRRFESFGSNCEFAFIQRRHGVEVSGLLRWGVVPFSSLVEGLSREFADVYAFEHLVPFTDGMVKDTAYDLCWHSRLRSAVVDGRRQFVDGEKRRREIHAEEAAKMNHLRDVTMNGLAKESRIYVYKSARPVEGDQRTRLASLIGAAGQGTLLFVTLADNEHAPGTVQQVGPNAFVGRLTEFAPHSKADAGDIAQWTAVAQAVADRIGDGHPTP